jgi:hypothetical protein
MKFVLTANDDTHMVDKRQSGGCFKPSCGLFASPVTREENRVQMIKLHKKQDLVANCEGLRPVSSAAVAQ